MHVLNSNIYTTLYCVMTNIMNNTKTTLAIVAVLTAAVVVIGGSG
jgi:hypothetical protein